MGKYQRQLEDPDQIENGADVPAVEVDESSKKHCFGEAFKVLVIGCLVFCVAIAIGLVVDMYYLRKPPPRTAVVTDASECTKIANDILHVNDNAVDAAIAAVVCLTVVRPDQSSLASGGYMLIRNTGETNSLDFQYAAPGSIHRNTSNVVAVPGLLPGLKAAHSKYGNLPIEKLLQPSIQLAYKGFIVANSTAENMRRLEMENYFIVNGKPVVGGDVLKVPILSELLRKIANDSSSLHQDIIKTVSANNGSMSMEDFDEYKVVWKKPVEVRVKGSNVVSTDLPSSGVLLLSALNILKQFPNVNASIATAVIAQVLKAILPKHELLEDPAFVSSQRNNTFTVLSDVKAKEYAIEIQRQLSGKQANVEEELNSGMPQMKSSATVSVINLRGDAVSIITSLGDVFGAKVKTDSGVILNNGLTTFSGSGKTNRMEPFKRPSSYASPAFIVNQEMISSFAPSANERGLASIIQVMKKILLDGSNEFEAVNYPRLFFNTKDGELTIEGERFLKFGLKQAAKLLRSQFQKVTEVGAIGSVNVAFKTKSTNATLDSR